MSYECERKFKAKFGEALPTCVIYNPVPTAEIINKASERPVIVLSDGRFNIVCMGRFTPQKGFDRLLEALNALKERSITGFHVTILGDGYERTILQQKVREYELESIVTMPGYVDNPYPIIKQADLFALTSRDESFSLAVAEAMVLGIPVMSTRCTGPVELLKNGDAGWLVENSTEGILSGLERILTDPVCYQELLAKAKANTNNFDMDEQISKVESLIDG